MNVNDTKKLISAIQSFADRLKNDDRSSIMFEADWDTLMYAKAYLLQQQKEIEILKVNLEHSYGLGVSSGFIKGKQA